MNRRASALRAASDLSRTSLLARLLSRFSDGRPAKPLAPRLRFQLEALEPRLLLSADLAPQAADALADGLDQLGNRLDDFVSNESLFDERVPTLLSVKKNADGIVVDEAPGIGDLFTVPVDANGDGAINGQAFFSGDDDELILEDLDADGDDRVDIGEFLKGWFFDPVAERLHDGDFATTGEFENFLKNGTFLFDLDEKLDELSGLYTIEFKILDGKVSDSTEDPDAEVSFSVGFSLTITQSMPIDLGLEADALKLLPFTGPSATPEPPTVAVTSDLTFAFDFGVLTGGQAAAAIDENDFFIRSAEPMIVSAKAVDTDLDFKLNIGFLGAEVVNGSFDLQADIETTLLDPNDPDVIGFVDVQHGVEQTGGVVTADNSLPSADLAHDAGFFLRLGNIGITTPVLVADLNRTDLNDLLGDIQDALDNAGLGGLVQASLVGADSDTVRFSLVATSDSPLGLANEVLSLTGLLSGTPAGDGPNAFEYLNDQMFLLSLAGAVPKLVTVRFPDPAREDLGFGFSQAAGLADDLVAPNAATAFDISGNANFTVTVTLANGTQYVESVVLTATETDGRIDAAGLADALDDQFSASPIYPLVLVGATGDGKIRFEALDSSVSAIRVQASGTATTEMGFASDAAVTLSMKAANNAVASSDLSGTATLHVTVTTAGSGTVIKHVTVAADANSNIGELAADVDAALSAQGLAIDAVAEGSRIVLRAQNVNIAAFDVEVGNQDIDDLVADVNSALNDAGFGGQVSAAANGGQLELHGAGGQSLEITRTLTFDAGVTYAELLGTPTAQLFSPNTGSDSHVTFTLPVQVLPGLEDASTAADDDYDPSDVAIVGNFNPFGALSIFDANEQRFNLNFSVDPALGSDPAIAVPSAASLEDEIKLVNFAELLQFNVVGAESMVGLLTQLGQTLDRLASSGQFSLYDIPFSDAALSDLLVFGDLIQTGLIYDFGADGQLNEDATRANNHSDLTDDEEISRLMVRSIVPADGPDSVELLPSFVTAQELATRLSELLGIPLGPDGINASYNPGDGAAGNELTYTISLVSNDRISIGIEEAFEQPFEFDVGLPPFREFTVDTVDSGGGALDAQVTLKGYTSLDMTFGVDLDPVAPIDYSDGGDGTLVADLNNQSGVGIKLERAVTGAETVRKVFGIGSDATFMVQIGGDEAVQVTLSKAAVDATDGSLAAFAEVLEDAINDAVSGATVAVALVADAPGFAQNRLQITAGGESIDLVPVAGDPSALTELGFDPQAASATTLTGIGSAPSLYALTGTASFDITIGAQTSTISLTAAETAGNRTIAELVADVNNKLRASGLLVLDGGVEEGIRAEFDAGRLVLTATDPGTVFSVTVNGATAAGTIAHEQLGLALGTTAADQADLIVVDRDGVQHRVTLDAVASGNIDDLIDAINAAAAGAFEAGPNATGTGLRLTDLTVGPDNRPALAVATVNGSLAALKLGFLSNPTNPDDPDNPAAGQAAGNPAIVEGGPIGTQSLPDRFFVRDGEMTAGFTMELPDDGIAGDALVGIVGVDVVMKGGLGAQVSAQLHAPGGASGSKVTLSQLQDGVGETDPAQQVMTDPQVDRLSTLGYDNQFASFKAGHTIKGGTSGATAVILEVGNGVLTLFDVEGTFQDNEQIVDTVSAFDGFALANGVATSTSHFGEFDLDYAVKEGFSEPGFGSAIGTMLDGLTGSVPVNLTVFGDVNADTDPVVEMVDVPGNLGDLHDFAALDYGHLSSALEELEGLVIVLQAQFVLLDQKLPIVNRSFRDLLGIADAFSLSVDNFSAVIDEAVELLQPGQPDVPALTLQGIAVALRGAFGLPDDSPALTVDASDGMLTIDLDLAETVSTTLGLDVDLSEGGLPNLTSGKILQVSGELAARFKIGIELDDPSTVHLFEENAGLTGSLSIEGNGAENLGLVFQAMAGDVPVLVRDGLVDMDLAFTLDAEGFSGGKKLLSEVEFADFVESVPVESFIASIPLFDPSAGLTGFLGTISADGGLAGVSLPDLDDLADQLDGISAAIAEFNPLDNLLLLSDNIDFFLESLQDFFDVDLFDLQLPIVGSSLADGARFIEDFRVNFINELRNTIESTPAIAISHVTGLIEAFFADAGIGLSGLTPTFDLTNDDVTQRFVQWDFTLSDSLTVPFNLDFDLGIPLLDMDVDIPLDITIGWSLDFGFGVSFEEGAYINVANEEELQLSVDIDLPASQAFDGTLGFLQLLVENNGSGVHLEFDVDLTNGGTDAPRLGFSDLGNLEFDAYLQGGAIHDKVLDLDMSVGIAGVATVFPHISTHFVLDWELPKTALSDLSAGALSEGLKLIALEDIRLDAGSFLNDFLGAALGEVTKFTEPFDGIIETLTAPIPILSDLAGEAVTLLDLAGVFGEVDTGFIDWIEKVLNVIDIINDLSDGTSLGIEIGSLTLFDAEGETGAVLDVGSLFDTDLSFDDVIPDLGSLGGALTQAFGSFDEALDAADTGGGTGDAQGAKDALKTLREGSLKDLLAFPFLDDPLQIVGLLLGKQATLIELDAPPLLVGFDYTQVFPIFGPLAATVGLGFEVGFDFSFGFDTYGFKRFADSDFTNPALIFDGFFLGDRENVTSGADIPEVHFEFNLTVAAELNLAIARAGVGLQGTAFIGFDLFDPNNDGAIHLSELISTIENQLRSDEPGLAPLSIFDLQGGLILELFAFLIIDFGIFEVDYEFPITPEIQVLDFGFAFDRPPILANDLHTGTLQLNMGPNSVDRLNGDTRDGSEEFHVRKTTGGIEVWSARLGVSEANAQEYKGDFNHIVALGGQGNDTIVLHGFDESDITAELDGGVGNDTIEFVEDASATPATGAGAIIRGGEGNDTLIGSHLDDIIIGGLGDDHIEGGRGYDVLFGDIGTVGNLPGGERFISGRVSVKDGDDEVYGGSSTEADLADADADDIIVGGGGEDALHGDGGSDVIIGDGGRLLYTLQNGHVDTAALRPDAFVPNDKADPSPARTTSQKIQDIYVQLNERFSGTDLGAGADDALFGGAGGDFLFGGGADDTISGEDGDDYVMGGLGFDTISGGEGNDTLFGNAQNDTIDGEAGNDVISGDFGDDVIHGNTGDDYMIGGRGLDVMYGDEDDDEVWGEGEPDVLFGGIGNDLVMGGVGADIMFGDDGIVAKLDKANPASDIRVGIGNPALITAAMRAAADDVAGSLDLILTDPVALDGNDYMSGDAGGDVMLGGGGDDLMGGDVDPRLAIANTPQITTESGRDILIGDGGIVQFDNRRLQRVASVVDEDPASFRDTIYGDNGNDVIIGGQGGDSGSFMLGTREVTRMLAGGHGTGRGDTDLEVTDEDIIIGDNGELLYADDSIAANFGRLEMVRTTDTSNATGGADTAAGELGDDVIFGGVNGSIDILAGNAGNDVILGDNGELDFALGVDADLDTLDLIRSYRDGLGGTDEISGNAGDDVLIGGTGGDSMYGDATALAGLEDGDDVMLGDNADLFLIGNTGRLKVRVADMPAGTAIDLVTTTDDVLSGEGKGGADTMSGNAGADIIIGGVNNGGQDVLYGDRALPTPSSISHDGHDILLGDNGLLDFTFEDMAQDRTVLDLIRSFEDGMGAVDVISGNKGADVAIGGSAGDQIYGDDAAASANGHDGGDMLLGDNADIFLVAPGLASGGDLKRVLDAAVRVIRTTDEEHPEYGGSDTISGNARGDIIAGGVQGDTLFGDRANPSAATAADEGDDILLGDNGAFEWLSNGRLGEISGIDIAANNAPLWAKYGAGAADGDLTTLDLITTEQPTNGGRDTIFGDEGNDLVFGGTDADTIHGDDGDEVANGAKANRDVLLGDHGRLYPQFSALNGFNSRNFFAIDVGDAGGGEGDRIRGEEGDDVLLGQQGDDRMWGGSGDDDMTGGHNVAGGYDELGAPAISALLDLPVNDLMDGGSGDDALAGDNAIIWRRGDDISPRFRQLTAAAIYSTTNSTITANIGAIAQSDPDDAVGRDIELVDHSDTVQVNPLGRFGADVMAGGADSDALFGQLGDDIMQGDGNIGADDANAVSITRSIAVVDSGSNPDTDQTLYFNIPEAVTDADDYMEGNGGSDLMYGGLGQDDMIGGSSALFGLTSNEERPDGSDFMFGGAGLDIARNHAGDAIEDAVTHEITTGAGGHARDADYIMGDNANVFRLTTTGDAFRTFVYDNYAGNLRIVPRAMQQLDYTLGGADWAGGAYSNGAANADNGAADLIYGESGDDTLFGMTGSDVLFGDGQDDDIVGGYGHDWISGGTGQDGVLGDDGLIRTSRNNSTVGEPLNSVAALLATDPDAKYSNGNVLNELISTPGGIQTATINKAGDLKKTADLVPFSYDPQWTASDDEYPDNQDGTPFADDIIFGGLGSDFLHGGSGDDAISGAEALDHAYVPVYDAAGNPTGVLDLGYLAVGIPGAVNPGDIAAFNPVDLDGRHLNNRFRAGEFALYDEYDPLRKILLTATGGLSKSGAGLEFLLNFNQGEGMVRAGGTVPGATGQQTTSYGPVRDDGTDVLFGDLGNDWLVGGTGRDNMYGGWGNDLINADDDLTTLGDAPKHGDPQVVGANDRPDTHPFYEDRAYGGAGRDVLIANTGGDRLIDWVGEYNSYLVPFAPFGMATVSRTLQPQLAEFLLALSKSDGADPTRPADTGADPLRNGEPDGELGMVRQRDLAWQDQTGAPSDPQAGNIPGGPRDVLRSAGFNEGTMDGFFIDSGKFAVSGNSLQVAADSTYGDAVSVYHVGDALPAYFEVQASVEIIKATGGWKGNSYIIFDYASATDFKFAGIDQSSNKLVIGHKASWGWAVDKQVPFQAKADTVYNILLAVNGLNATVIVNNQKSVTHTFQPRIADGVSNGLNYGMVGVGSDSSRGKFDNIRVQVLPPQTTFISTETFADGIADQIPLSRETGTWTFGSGRYLGLPAAGGTLATSLIDLGVDGLNTASLLELTGTVSTQARAGFIFDRYSATDFKFVAIDAASDQVIIGHHTTRGGWSTDAFVSRQIDAGTDYKLGVSIKGTTVSVTLGGQAILGHAFNAVAVDGGFGLLASGGPGSFDSVTVRTNDPAFAHAGGSALVAAAESIVPIEARAALTQAQLDSVARFAIAEWTETLGDGDPRLASLGDVRLVVQDLDGGELGYSEQGLLVVDVDGAGHGWFVDASPASSEEFRVRLDRNIVAAAPPSEAAMRMDLVTVVGHELGHLLGLSHDDAARYAIMEGDLSAGERHLFGDTQQADGTARFANDPGAHIARLVAEEEAWRFHQKAGTAAAARMGNPGSDGARAVAGTGAAMTSSMVDWQGHLQGASWMPFSAFGTENFRGNGALFPDFANEAATEDKREAGPFDPLGEALLGGVGAGKSQQGRAPAGPFDVAPAVE